MSTAFFASPAKAFLAKKIKIRAGVTASGKGVGLKRVQSAESLAQSEPVLGLPAEPQRDLEELVGELKKELEARQRRDSLKKSS